MPISLEFSVPQQLNPWDPTKGGVTNPEPGVYKGKTIEVEEHTGKSGKSSIRFAVELETGETVDIYAGRDFTKDANVRKMQNIILAHGGKLEKAKGQTITLSDEAFVGKKVFVIVKKVDGMDEAGRAKLNDRDFATKEQAEAWASAQSGAAGAGKKAGNAAANGGSLPPAGKSEGASAASSLFDE